METRNKTAPEIDSLTSLYIQRAEIYFKMKEYGKCLEDLRQILRLKDSVQYEIYFLLAVCFRETGEFENAIENINKAIMTSGDRVPVYLIERGFSYYHLGKYTLAIKDLVEGLRHYDYFPEATRMLALSFDKIGDFTGTMENMFIAAEQGDKFAIDYIKRLGNFADFEYNELFSKSYQLN